MRAPVDVIFPPVQAGLVPYWRLVLRGCSQLCFQSNELTGLFFLAGVLIASSIAFAYLLVGAIIAPGGRMLLGERGPVLATGLPGLNPSLIALSLPTFYQTGWTDVGMWILLVVCVASAVVLVRLGVAILPFPTLVLPFLIISWVLAALAPEVDILQPTAFSSVAETTFDPVKAVLSSLGEAILSPTVWSASLFLAGVLLSNWRHALLALFGALIGTVVAYYYRHVDPASVDLGLDGFNGVLAAVAVFAVCGGKLRLAILGAILATMRMPVIAALGVQTVSAPFVFTTWLMLALGWVEEHWLAPPEPAAPAGPASGPDGASLPAAKQSGD